MTEPITGPPTTDATDATALRASVLRVLHGIAPEVDPATIRPDASLREQVDLDSMDFLNFVMGLAQAFGVEVAERDYPELATLDGCVAYLGARGARTV